MEVRVKVMIVFTVVCIAAVIFLAVWAAWEMDSALRDVDWCGMMIPDGVDGWLEVGVRRDGVLVARGALLRGPGSPPGFIPGMPDREGE